MTVKIGRKSKTYGHRTIIVEGRETISLELAGACRIEIQTGATTVVDKPMFAIKVACAPQGDWIVDEPVKTGGANEWLIRGRMK